MIKSKSKSKAKSAKFKTKASRKAVGKTPKVTQFHHVIIVDESGSMFDVRDVTHSGLNEQIQTIRKLGNNKGETHGATIVAFNTTVRKVVDDIHSTTLKDLTYDEYVPDGNTALYDAIGSTVTNLKKKYDKNTKVLLTIMTDGAENASREFTQEATQRLLKEIQDTLNWTVTFLGANINVQQTAISLSIPLSNSVQYKSTPANAKLAFSHANQARTSYTASVSRSVAGGQSAGGIICASNLYSQTDTVKDITGDDEQPKNVSISFSSSTSKPKKP